MQTKSFIRFTALALAIVFTTPVFSAEDASMHQVYLAAEAGKFNEAQAMMDKVLHDHPNSAKAHYVEAELLAKQGHFAGAETELNTAERLKPGLSFTKPQALQKLKAQIASSHPITQSAGNQSSPSPTRNGTPWGLIFLGAGLIAFIYFAAKFMTRRNPPLMPANSYPGAANVNPQPYGGNAAPMMAPTAAGGIGSGIMGGLATGVAVGAGMVAGEALMHHFTDGEHSNSFVNEAHANNAPEIPNDMGGSDFGIADNSSWDDDSGGDDWT